MTSSGDRLPSGASLESGALAGQLVCVALRDYAGQPDRRRAFLEEARRHGWGGVIVFGGEPAAVADLVAAADEHLPAPLLVTGDFERGFGQQFPGRGTSFPPLMALGAATAADPAGGAALAREVGRAVGRELRAGGFHVDFWPVADLADEPANPIVGTRAAGDDPAVAAAVVAAVVEGLQETGVAATVKHWPGHGRTTLDSHEVLPVVEATRAELERADWVPFRAGLAAGARIVMTAHVTFPALEPDGARDRPATFSRTIDTEILRGDLGFDGVVSSDALMMGALSGEPPAAAAMRALSAGVDWLLYPPDPPGVVAGLAAALVEGRIDRVRAEEAAGRVLELKRWAFSRPPLEPDGMGARALADAVAAAALTADPASPPGDPAWSDGAQWVVVLDGAIEPREVVLAEGLSPEAAGRLLVIDAADPAAATARLAEVQERCDESRVACAVFNPVRAWKGRAGLSPAALEVVRSALGAAAESALLLFSNPRIINELDTPSRVVWAYGEDPASQRAALAFLRGERAANGRPPVRLRA
ncbi:MAG TPA: glycoside hydrolase family 3 N-terminal domain-containing protein [Gemmatimonadota bacterium]|nr:glycoside hydrolase family 3 N-terminal domain-containing protein [Gemmatimonadota bacterium]